MNHKHKGVLLSNGSLRPHPIERQHGDLIVKKEHNLSLNGNDKQKYLQQYKKDDTTKTTEKKEKLITITPEIQQQTKLPIDSDNYLNIDLEKSKGIKGIRIKFVRTEGRVKRTVGLEIDKE
jgi:hypothetical protein